MIKVFLLDNNDSFTHNLSGILKKHKNIDFKINSPENTNINEISEYNKIIFSPGPGIPTVNSLMGKVLDIYQKSHSILGICLGHQTIALKYGASVENLTKPNHGKVAQIKILKDNNNNNIFKNLPEHLDVGLYHSWVVKKHSLTDSLIKLAECNEGNIMAIKHKEYDITGLQFHPESFITKHGGEIIYNWLSY